MWRLYIIFGKRYHAAAAPNIIIAKNTSNAIVIIAKMLPKQPQFLSPSGKLSDKSAKTNPMSGVNSTDKKKVHPNPMRLLAPTNPTNADTKVSDSNPKINNVKPIEI